MDWIKVGTDTTMQQDPDVDREMGTLVAGRRNPHHSKGQLLVGTQTQIRRVSIHWLAKTRPDQLVGSK